MAPAAFAVGLVDEGAERLQQFGRCRLQSHLGRAQGRGEGAQPFQKGLESVSLGLEGDQIDDLQDRRLQRRLLVQHGDGEPRDAPVRAIRQGQRRHRQVGVGQAPTHDGGAAVGDQPTFSPQSVPEAAVVRIVRQIVQQTHG
ncbi:hypothetical protein D3C73_1013620 [compost metagenome]